MTNIQFRGSGAPIRTFLVHLRILEKFYSVKEICAALTIRSNRELNPGPQMLVLLPGFQKGFSRKRAGSSFGKKKGNLRRTRKNLKNGQKFTPFWVSKMFSLKL
jgi:hypothetical protein